MKKEYWAITAAFLSLACGAALALGFKTPEAVQKAIENRLEKNESEIVGLKVGQAVANERLDSMADGLEKLSESLGHPTRFRKRDGRH